MTRDKTIGRYGRIFFRETTPEEVDLVYGMERDPDNVPFVGQWSREEHLGAITNPAAAHWMVRATDDGRVQGFVILSNIDRRNRSIEFRRIVMQEKGRGYGRETLQLVKRIAFEELGAHRLWLDVMEHNERARHLYRSEGFLEEGRLRECMRVGDRYVSLVVLGMLEDEYRQGKRSGSSSAVASG